MSMMLWNCRGEPKEMVASDRGSCYSSSIGRCHNESRSKQLMAARAKIPALASDWPSAIAMSGKLRGSELKRRLCRLRRCRELTRLALSRTKPLMGGGGNAPTLMLGTIGGGTSQIQKNIIGEWFLACQRISDGHFF